MFKSSIIIFLSIIVTVASCIRNERNNDFILGNWAYAMPKNFEVVEDSIYNANQIHDTLKGQEYIEVFFDQKEVYFYSSLFGYAKKKYEIRSDTICFYSDDSDPYFIGVLANIEPNKFEISIAKLHITLYRIEGQMNLSDVIQKPEREIATNSEYLNAFMERKERMISKIIK